MILITKIVQIDQRGNVFLDTKNFELEGFNLGDSLSVNSSSGKINGIPFYSGLYCKMFDSVLVAKNGTIYLAIRHGDAAKKYNLYVGQQLELFLNIPGYFWEKENAYSFEKITDRTLYEDVDAFANFRPLLPGRRHFLWFNPS